MCKIIQSQNVVKNLLFFITRAGLRQKIVPGIFLVQAAHQHFELYIIYIYIYIQEEHVPAR